MAHERGLDESVIENELNNSDFEVSDSDEDGDSRNDCEPFVPNYTSSSSSSDSDNSHQDSPPQRLSRSPLRGRSYGRSRTVRGRNAARRLAVVANSANARKWSENDFAVQNTGLMEPSYLPTDTDDFEKVDYFSQYIDSNIIDTVVTKTNQTAIRTTGRSLNLTAEELYVYIGATFVMSTIGYPQIRMYWEQKWRIGVIADNISRNRFLTLRMSLKMVFDDDITSEQRKNDKLWKVRPLLNKVVEGCRLQMKQKDISVDEMIIPFTGSCGMKQYCPGKPNPTGLKAFVLANPDGLVCDLLVYQGLTTFAESAFTNFGLGEKTVLTLAQSLVPGHTIYCDRYFTSEKLIDELHSRGIFCTGTVMKNRIPRDARAHLRSDRELKNHGRGTSQVLVRDDGKIALTRWLDNKPVTLLSSVQAKDPEDYCQRWCKAEKRYITLKRPIVVQSYNQNMGGVDMADRLLSICPNRYRTRKWTQRFFSHMLDLAVSNSWLQFRKKQLLKNVPRTKIQQLRSYKLELGENLIETNVFIEEGEPENENTSDVGKRRGRAPAVPVPSKIMRTHAAKHLPEFVDKRNRCRKCQKNTFVKCIFCNIYLCFHSNRNCFKIFHE